MRGSRLASASSPICFEAANTRGDDNRIPASRCLVFALEIFYYLYGAITAAQISIMLEYELDERLTLSNIKDTLESTLEVVKSTRDELNQLLGGCARQRRLAYDKATNLLALADDVGKVVTPVLHRVKLNMLLPFPRKQ
jgi:hypothetical protein